MKVRYKLTDTNNILIFSSLSTSDEKIIITSNGISFRTNDKKLRYGTITRPTTGIISAITEDIDLINSSKSFKKTIEFLLDSSFYIKEALENQQAASNKSMARLVHNLSSLNGHNIQEIYSIIPQENLAERKSGHLTYVKSIIANEPDEAAAILLRIAKNNAAIKTEISVFKKIFNKSPQLRPANHSAHKVLMNILHLFFPDFTDKNVRVDLEKTTLTAYFDYESIHVALFHLIDNAAKYIAQNSTLKILIQKSINGVEFSFEMPSLPIQEKEKDTIFTEGVSGSVPIKLGKAGSGVGMGLIRSLVQLNNGQFYFITNQLDFNTVMGIRYENNKFILTLPAGMNSIHS